MNLAPIPNTVSVDAKQHLKKRKSPDINNCVWERWTQAPVPNSPYGLCRHKAALQKKKKKKKEEEEEEEEEEV